MINYIKTHTLGLAISVAILVLIVIIASNSIETRDEKIENCLNKPSDKGVELCLQWLVEKEKTNQP